MTSVSQSVTAKPKVQKMQKSAFLWIDNHDLPFEKHLFPNSVFLKYVPHKTFEGSYTRRFSVIDVTNLEYIQRGVNVPLNKRMQREMAELVRRLGWDIKFDAVPEWAIELHGRKVFKEIK